MRTFLNFMVFMAMAIALTGCGSLFQQEPPPVQYKTVVIAPDDNLLANCDVEAPPAKDEFVAATPDRRVVMLGNTVSKGYKNADVCNERWAKLREWKKKELDLQKEREKKKGGK